MTAKRKLQRNQTDFEETSYKSKYYDLMERYNQLVKKYNDLIDKIDSHSDLLTDVADELEEKDKLIDKQFNFIKNLNKQLSKSNNDIAYLKRESKKHVGGRPVKYGKNDKIKVLRLVNSGKTIREIAKKLKMSTATVIKLKNKK